MRASRIVEIARSMQMGNDHPFIEQLVASKLMDTLANPEHESFECVKRAVDFNLLLYVIHKIDTVGPDAQFWVSGKGFVPADIEFFGIEDITHKWLPVDGDWMPVEEAIRIVQSTTT